MTRFEFVINNPTCMDCGHERGGCECQFGRQPDQFDDAALIAPPIANAPQRRDGMLPEILYGDVSEDILIQPRLHFGNIVANRSQGNVQPSAMPDDEQDMLVPMKVC